jgi:hypothetical protein
MGTLAPAILSTHSNLNEVKATTVKPLVNALILGLENRFSYILDLDLTDTTFHHALMAAISHPYFKLRWIPSTHLIIFKQAFLDDAVTFGAKPDIPRPPSTSKFFKFPSEGETEAAAVEQGNAAHLECLQYFQNPDIN